MTLPGHKRPLQTVAVTPDGGRLVSGADDGTVRVSDMERGVELRTLSGHADMVWSVALTTDGQRVVSCGSDGTVRV